MMMVVGHKVSSSSSTTPSSPEDEIQSLKSHLSSVSAERNLLRDTLHSLKVRGRTEVEDGPGRQAAEYESKLAELHSVIFELRRELAEQRNRVIREESPEEATETRITLNSNNPQVGDLKSTTPDNNNNRTKGLPPKCPRKPGSQKPRKALQSSPSPTNEDEEPGGGGGAPGNKAVSELAAEIGMVRAEHEAIRETLRRKDAELRKTRNNLASIASERDFLRNKVAELEDLVMRPSEMSTSEESEEGRPKKAERVRLRNRKDGFTTKPLGSELLQRAKAEEELNGRVAEEMVRGMVGEADIREMEGSFRGLNADERMREFEVEADRLTSRMDHLRSQNDLLTLNLDQAKGNSHRLTVLLGKYESNNVALQIALNISDQTIEAYDVLVALLESELGLLLANCRAAGIGGVIPPTRDPMVELDPDGDPIGTMDLGQLLQRANSNRSTALDAARSVLTRNLDSPGSEREPKGGRPWEDSTGSQTLSSESSSVGESSGVSSGGSGGCCSLPEEEQRIRDVIVQLKTDRESVRSTVLEMEESWSLSDDLQPTCDTLEARRLDLETAVLLQELMAMREERSELRAHNFLLEKDKRAMELRLSGVEGSEEALRETLWYLQDQLRATQNLKTTRNSADDNDLDEGMAVDDNANELQSTSTTGEDIKGVEELVGILERVTRGSRERESEAGAIIEELRCANGALVDALEGLKRKWRGRVRKLEEQMMDMAGRHARSSRALQQRIQELEERGSEEDEYNSF